MDSLEYVRGIPAALYKKEPLEFHNAVNLTEQVANVLYNDVVTIRFDSHGTKKLSIAVCEEQKLVKFL
jgi:hypothetical protein